MNALLTVLALLLIPSYAVATEIKDTVVASQEVKPDVYCVSVTVSVRGNSEAFVLQSLKRADDYVKRLHLRYTGGNFTLYPETEWNPVEKRYFVTGFAGKIRYTFQLKDPAEQEEIVRALETAKVGAPLTYTISSVGWCISEPLKRRTLLRLKLKALKEAEREASVFGREFHSTCRIEKISFLSSEPPLILETLRKGKLALPEPPQTSKRLTVKASTVIKCK